MMDLVIQLLGYQSSDVRQAAVTVILSLAKYGKD